MSFRDDQLSASELLEHLMEWSDKQRRSVYAVSEMEWTLSVSDIASPAVNESVASVANGVSPSAESVSEPSTCDALTQGGDALVRYDFGSVAALRSISSFVESRRSESLRSSLTSPPSATFPQPDTLLFRVLQDHLATRLGGIVLHNKVSVEARECFYDLVLALEQLGPYSREVYVLFKTVARAWLAENRILFHRPCMQLRVKGADDEMSMRLVSYVMHAEDGELQEGFAFPTIGCDKRASPAGLAVTSFSSDVQVVARHGRLCHAWHAECLWRALEEVRGGGGEEEEEEVRSERVVINLNLLGLNATKRIKVHEALVRDFNRDNEYGAQVISFNLPVRPVDIRAEPDPESGWCESGEDRTLFTAVERNKSAYLALVEIVLERTVLKEESQLRAEVVEELCALGRAKGGALADVLESRCAAAVESASEQHKRVFETLLTLLRHEADEASLIRGWGYDVLLLLHLTRICGLRKVSINCKSGQDRTGLYYAVACAEHAVSGLGFSEQVVHEMMLRFPEIAAGGVDSLAPDVRRAVACFRRVCTQHLFSIGVATTSWNTGFPGFKYHCGPLSSWTHPRAHPNDYALPFVARHVRLQVAPDQDQRVAIAEDVHDQDGHFTHRRWTLLGTILFEGIGCLRSS